MCKEGVSDCDVPPTPMCRSHILCPAFQTSLPSPPFSAPAPLAARLSCLGHKLPLASLPHVPFYSKPFTSWVALTRNGMVGTESLKAVAETGAGRATAFTVSHSISTVSPSLVTGRERSLGGRGIYPTSPTGLKNISRH